MKHAEERMMEAAFAYINSKTNTTRKAYKLGQMLDDFRETLPRGEFIPWAEDNLPLSTGHCHKCIMLSRIPGLLKVKKLLTLRSELRLRREEPKTIKLIRDYSEHNHITDKKLMEILGDDLITKIQLLSLIKTVKEKKDLLMPSLTKNEKKEIQNILKEI